MSLRAIATLVIAVVLGLAAVLIVNGFLNHGPKAPTQVAATVAPGSPVVVASKAITRGVVVTPDMLKIVEFPAGSAPDGSFSAINQLTGAKDVERVALRDLAPGEPVLRIRVSDPGMKINLSDILKPGMQAVSLRSSDVNGVAGFIQPGDHVDVFLTRTTTPPGGGPETSLVQVVAQNLKVLGIDQNDDEENSHPTVVKAITVEVTPQQAQTITIAQTLGTVSFSLRHVQDSNRLTRVATTQTALDFSHPVRRVGKKKFEETYGVVRVTRDTDTTVYQLSAR